MTSNNDPSSPLFTSPSKDISICLKKASISIASTNHQYSMEDTFDQTAVRRRRSTMTLWISALSRRLGRRQDIYNRIGAITNAMCFLGLLGVVLMIVSNEMIFMNVNGTEKALIWFIQIIITTTTVALVSLVFYYHYLVLSLHTAHRSVNHWRVGLTREKVSFILLEAFICSIHPFPHWYPFDHSLPKPNLTIFRVINSTSTLSSSISFNVGLGLPMFVRIYLLCRLVMFRSHLVQNASSQSLGCLNQVSMNFFFLVKTYLDQWPTRCLLPFCIFLLLACSWGLRACNYNSQAEHMSMLDSMWLCIVTFTTVGYGDLTPTTYCGRGIAAFTGLIGVFSTALLISVLAQKLQLTRSEKYVHHFDLNLQLAKERRNQAANIIKFAMKSWFLKRKGRRTSNQYHQAERKLFRAIHMNHQLEQRQRKLADTCVGLPELLTLQRNTNLRVEATEDCVMEMQSKITQIEEKLSHIDETMVHMQKSLNFLVERLRR